MVFRHYGKSGQFLKILLKVCKVMVTNTTYNVIKCILMDFPIRIDTVSMGLPIVHFKSSRVEFPKL